MLCSRDKRICGTGVTTRNREGMLYHFDTGVRNTMARRCVSVSASLCVYVEKKMSSFFMAVQRLFDVPVAALAVPGPRLGNSE